MRTFLYILGLMLMGPVLVWGQAEGSDTLVAPCMPCEELTQLALPDVRVETARALARPVRHCRVAGRVGKEIRFELVLPEAWNTRFSFSGNGGFAGSIQTGHGRLRLGFANVATDTGHRGAPLDASWALHHAERQVNFGHLAVHRVTVVAKSILRQYYGRGPAYSYFMGCSRGGGQGMMAAQRYPGDFDGIVAGAPAFNWPATAAEIVRNSQALFGPLGPEDPLLLDTLALRLLHSQVLAQCDSLDGLADGILQDPRACALRFEDLPRCPPDAPAEGCFTEAQVRAIREVYRGVRIDGRSVHPGFPPGGEGDPRGWRAWITGPDDSGLARGARSNHLAFGTGIFKYFVYQDSTWNYRTYDFEDYFSATALTAATLDATSTDYSAFAARKGKMILYHGWNDPALSALATINHYERALRSDPALAETVRLFLLPGVMHCGGGPGPGSADWLGLIQDWVERGQAPDRVEMVKRQGPDTLLTRPVFPYPEQAVYDGQGDPRRAGSFRRQ